MPRTAPNTGRSSNCSAEPSTCTTWAPATVSVSNARAGAHPGRLTARRPTAAASTAASRVASHHGALAGGGGQVCSPRTRHRAGHRRAAGPPRPAGPRPGPGPPRRPAPARRPSARWLRGRSPARRHGRRSTAGRTSTVSPVPLSMRSRAPPSITATDSPGTGGSSSTILGRCISGPGPPLPCAAATPDPRSRPASASGSTSNTLHREPGRAGRAGTTGHRPGNRAASGRPAVAAAAYCPFRSTRTPKIRPSAAHSTSCPAKEASRKS